MKSYIVANRVLNIVRIASLIMAVIGDLVPWVFVWLSMILFAVGYNLLEQSRLSNPRGNDTRIQVRKKITHLHNYNLSLLPIIGRFFKSTYATNRIEQVNFYSKSDKVHEVMREVYWYENRYAAVEALVSGLKTEYYFISAEPF